ncbi:MAG: DUF2332 domain-containing protein [Halobacteria archaeon]
MTELKDRIEKFAEVANDGCLFERISRRVLDDKEILELMAKVPENQPPAPMVLTAVHYMLLRGKRHPLRQYFVEHPREVDDDEMYREFRDFCLEYESEILDVIDGRYVQYNSVRRSTGLYPCFGYVEKLTGGKPTAYIEIGCSTGVNLLWNRYRYCYERSHSDEDPNTGNNVDTVSETSTDVTHGITADDNPDTFRDGAGEVDSTVIGNPEGVITVESKARNEVPVPREHPEVYSIQGIDINPIDLYDDTEVLWVLGNYSPDMVEDAEMYREAVELAREDPPVVHEGDAVEKLPEVVEEIPDDVPICIYNTVAVYEFPEESKKQLNSYVSGLMDSRDDVHWLYGEEIETDPVYGDEGFTIELRNSSGTEDLVLFHGDGYWVRWLDPPEP